MSTRQVTLRERQARLAALCDDVGARPSLTHGLIDQHLRDTARSVAELLSVAEHLDERLGVASQRASGWRGMRVLADACFEAILAIDAARQELVASLGADARLQRARRDDALRCARGVLTGLERQLAQALSN